MSTRYFLEGYLGSLERTMQAVPHFHQRGGGRVNGYRYTADDCDCSYCIHTPKPRKPCGLSLTDCPCLAERLDTGCITTADLIESLLPEIRSLKLRQRISGLARERRGMDMFFASTRHRALFNQVIHDGGLCRTADTGLVAALFLLTSNSFLWNRAQYAVWRSRIAFEDICIRGITAAKVDTYAIYKAAKELCLENGEHHIFAQELADETIVGECAFRLIIHAMLIKRCWLAAIQTQPDIIS